MKKPGKVFLGVDIGGTKVAAGLVSDSGRILTRAREAMSARGTAADGLAAVQAAIAAALDGRSALGIGISSPGPLDPRRGLVLNPPNLPCWRNFPLARAVEKTHRIPVRLDNDANAAALAEARWGAGRGYSAVFYATLGTGIGTGLILDGKIYHERTGAAVEGGHLSLNPHGHRCGCGQRGCIEALAAGPAVARRARLAVRRDARAGAALLRLAHVARPPLAGAALPAEGLWPGVARRQRAPALAHGVSKLPRNAAAIRAETVAEAWRAGDPLATAVLDETAALLARWLGAMVTLLEPEVIIFGGGMGRLMAHWFPVIRRQMPAWTLNSRAAEIPLRRARYGAEAGIAGAAALCLPS